jgi:hypothetical protein
MVNSGSQCWLSALRSLTASPAAITQASFAETQYFPRQDPPSAFSGQATFPADEFPLATDANTLNVFESED